MKKYLLLFFLVLLGNVWGQEVGDYGTKATGNWGSNNANWVVCATAGTWTGATTPSGAPTITNNVWIRSGHTVTVDASGKNCKNLYVENGGKLYSNTSATSIRYVNVYGNITCDGTIGNGSTIDGISFNIDGASCNISGSGVFDALRIRKNSTTNSTTNLLINMNVNLRYSETALYNAVGAALNIVIGSGYTLNCVGSGTAKGVVSIDGTNGAGGSASAGSIEVNGQLICRKLFLTTNNISPNSVSVTIKQNGTIEADSVICTASGSAGHTFTINSGGLLKFTKYNFGIVSSTNNTYDFAENSIVEYASNSNQILTSYFEYPTLKLSGNSIKTVDGTLKIKDKLTFNNGIIDLQNNDVVMGGSLILDGTQNAQNMIVTSGTGVVKKIFTANGSFVFPIGDNTVTAEYSPVTVNIVATSYDADAYVSAKVVNQKHPNNTSTTNFINRYWSLTSSGITNFLYDIEMQYTDADLNSGTDENSLYLGKYSGGSWTLLNKATAGSNTLSGTNLDSFSDFTGGESAALPVELTSFTAKYLSSGVVLNWQTATEINNNKFEVERQINEGNWDVVGEVLGHGNSNTVIDYTYTDSKTSTKGKYNYRLKQIDNDGTFKYTQVVNVTVGNIDNYELAQNYPNPFNPSTNINFTMPKAGNVKIVLFNALGQEVATLFNGNKDAGFHTVQFNANGLPSGIYFYQMTSEGFNQVRKMILAK